MRAVQVVVSCPGWQRQGQNNQRQNRGVGLSHTPPRALEHLFQFALGAKGEIAEGEGQRRRVLKPHLLALILQPAAILGMAPTGIENGEIPVEVAHSGFPLENPQ